VTAGRLARQQFHLMVIHGPALEKKQAQLFRCVDVGAELFAMAAVCSRAHRDAKAGTAGGADANALDLADVFCRQSRMKIENLFEAIRSNADPEAYRLARGVLDGHYAWLERGIVNIPVAAKKAPERQAAAGN